MATGGMGYAPALLPQALLNHVEIFCCFAMRFALDFPNDVGPTPGLQSLLRASGRLLGLCAACEQTFDTFKVAKVA